jgi:hypothetical protein
LRCAPFASASAGGAAAGSSPVIVGAPGDVVAALGVGAVSPSDFGAASALVSVGAYVGAGS